MRNETLLIRSQISAWKTLKRYFRLTGRGKAYLGLKNSVCVYWLTDFVSKSKTVNGFSKVFSATLPPLNYEVYRYNILLGFCGNIFKEFIIYKYIEIVNDVSIAKLMIYKYLKLE